MIKIGGDPEYFVRYNTLPSTQYEEDGLAIEYHIKPTDDLTNFQEQLLNVQKELKPEPKIIIDIDPAEIEPEKRILGCQASKNIYDNFCIPCDAEWNTYRSAGGHIHMSKEIDGKLQPLNYENLVRALDRTLGLWSVLAAPDKKAERKRRTVYGRAGEYRYRNNILEYRTLSNFWTFDPELIAVVFNTTKWLMEDEETTKNISTIGLDGQVRYIINEVDMEEALNLINEIKEVLGDSCKIPY